MFTVSEGEKNKGMLLSTYLENLWNNNPSNIQLCAET